jgi:hypothetical protein
MSAVRREYETMTRRFFELAERFDAPFDAQARADLLATIRAFEAMDRHIDAIADRATRHAAFERLAAHLAGATCELDAELVRHARILSGMLTASTRARFVAHLQRFFVHSERLRQTTEAAIYELSILEEARATAAMTTCIVPCLGHPPWPRVFARLAETANLVDKLHDVRADRRAGEVAIDPGLRLHLRLVGAFLRSALLVVIESPRPLSMLRWGIPFLGRPGHGAQRAPADLVTPMPRAPRAALAVIAARAFARRLVGAPSRADASFVLRALHRGTRRSRSRDRRG